MGITIIDVNYIGTPVKSDVSPSKQTGIITRSRDDDF